MQIIAKVGESVDITYQAKNSTSGLVDVITKIYDETRSPDLINFPDVTLTEIGTTGTYYGSFSPDAKGVWTTRTDSASKSSPMPQTIIVTDHNLDSIGAAVAALNNLSAAQVQSIVDGAETSILSAISGLENPAVLG